MSSVYPRATNAKAAPEPIDPAACAERIVAAREADPKASKALIVGIALQGSDDVAGFERAWDEIEAERVAMAAVSPASCATESAYRNELTAISKHLDAQLFVNGTLAEAGVATWAELKSKLAPAVVEEL